MNQIWNGKIWDSPRTRKRGCLGWLLMAVTAGRRAEGELWIIYLCTAWPRQLSGQKWDQDTKLNGKSCTSYTLFMGEGVEEDNKGLSYCTGGLVSRDCPVALEALSKPCLNDKLFPASPTCFLKTRANISTTVSAGLLCWSACHPC